VLDSARSALDSEKRKTLYKQAEELLAAEGAVMIPYFLPVLAAMRTTVQGFKPHPAGWVDLRDVKVLA
jgi:peptide/nickel transport system substrate-binding protein